jgi:CheY-like chemotaxis protein
MDSHLSWRREHGRVRQSAAPSNANSSQPGQLGRPATRRFETVLVVDDDPAVRNSVKWLLESEGYQVVTAPNGRRAINLLLRGLRPCLILLDLMMPGTDGWTFRRLQLGDARFADIPVVVYSGRGNQGVELPGVVQLAKPADAEVLLGVVSRHCVRG